MMQKFSIVIILLLSNLLLMGQETKREKLERLKAHKISFITSRLNLTAEEAQNFWPVYNDFFRKKEVLNRKKKAVTQELQNNWQDYSDDKKTELVNDLLVNFKLREAKLEKQYLTELQKVISIDKIIMLYKVETQWKTFLLQQIKQQAKQGLRNQGRESRRK